MTDELKAAVERLRDPNRNWFVLNDRPETGDNWLAKLHPDVEADINTLLAEHPPDDETPVGEAWWKTTNASKALSPRGRPVWELSGGEADEMTLHWFTDTRELWLKWEGHITTNPTPTRVRLLCRALGIELKEPDA